MSNKATNKSGSVLVDFYNLSLTGNARKDKPEILQFFERHAPEVVRQDITNTISQGHTLSEHPKPATVLSIKAPDPSLFGTLGAFEYFQEKSWFDHPDTVNFYGLHKLVHRVVDNYLSNEDLPRDLFAWVGSLPENIYINLIAVSSEGERHGTVTLPKSVKRSKYSFDETIAQHSKLSFSPGKQMESPLNLGGMKFRLFRDILSLWNGEMELQRCTFGGSKRNPPCKNVFIVGNRKRYCSKRCYDKARRYRRFDKTGL